MEQNKALQSYNVYKLVASLTQSVGDHTHSFLFGCGRVRPRYKYCLR